MYYEIRGLFVLIKRKHVIIAIIVNSFTFVVYEVYKSRQWIDKERTNEIDFASVNIPMNLRLQNS